MGNSRKATELLSCIILIPAENLSFTVCEGKNRSAVKSWKRPSVSSSFIVLFRVGPEPKTRFRRVQWLEAVPAWSPWTRRTADSCSQQTLMIALAMLFVRHFTVITTLPINYQLPCRVIILPILQMGRLRQRGWVSCSLDNSPWRGEDQNMWFHGVFKVLEIFTTWFLKTHS